MSNDPTEPKVEGIPIATLSLLDEAHSAGVGDVYISFSAAALTDSDRRLIQNDEMDFIPEEELISIIEDGDFSIKALMNAARSIIDLFVDIPHIEEWRHQINLAGTNKFIRDMDDATNLIQGITELFPYNRLSRYLAELSFTPMSFDPKNIPAGVTISSSFYKIVERVQERFDDFADLVQRATVLCQDIHHKGSMGTAARVQGAIEQRDRFRSAQKEN